MTIQLPSELTWALSLVGIDWPDADEDKLDQMGQEWLRFSKALTGFVDELVKQGDAVTSANSGTAIDAFQGSWTGPEAPLTNLRDGAEAAAEIALALGICAKIVTAYKGVVLAEIAAFAYSVAAAAAASSTGIGAIIGAGVVIARRIIAQQAIDAALNLAVEKILNG
jgi:hypothetical protein